MSEVDPRIEEIPEERRAATPGGECVHAIKVDLPAMSAGFRLTTRPVAGNLKGR